jgi:hypothetical protein
VVDKEMVVIKGHGRLLAAQTLGLATVPVAVADYLTPEEVAAARLADNKVSESEWEPHLLAGEFQALIEMDFDLELTGFEEYERRELLEMGDKTALGTPVVNKNRNLGKGQVRVKPVLALEDVAVFESWIAFPDRLAIAVNDGLRQKFKMNGAWSVGVLAEKVARYGNQSFYAGYKEICRELLEEKAAQAGYRLDRWTAYYCGFAGQMTHYGAILERT